MILIIISFLLFFFLFFFFFILFIFLRHLEAPAPRGMKRTRSKIAATTDSDEVQLEPTSSSAKRARISPAATVELQDFFDTEQFVAEEDDDYKDIDLPKPKMAKPASFSASQPSSQQRKGSSQRQQSPPSFARSHTADDFFSLSSSRTVSSLAGWISCSCFSFFSFILDGSNFRGLQLLRSILLS